MIESGNEKLRLEIAAQREWINSAKSEYLFEIEDS
jgi:hypothetical protein